MYYQEANHSCCPSRGKLIHLKIQAAIREHGKLNDIAYLGYEFECGEHMYNIGGHIVKASEIDEFEEVTEK